METWYISIYVCLGYAILCLNISDLFSVFLRLRLYCIPLETSEFECPSTVLMTSKDRILGTEKNSTKSNLYVYLKIGRIQYEQHEIAFAEAKVVKALYTVRNVTLPIIG